MFWQHIFIPVLPSHLMDYLTAPMPFLIGVPQTLFARTKMSELGDVVILDIDAKTFESPFTDVDNIPQVCPRALDVIFWNELTINLSRMGSASILQHTRIEEQV